MCILCYWNSHVRSQHKIFQKCNALTELQAFKVVLISKKNAIRVTSALLNEVFWDPFFGKNSSNSIFSDDQNGLTNAGSRWQWNQWTYGETSSIPRLMSLHKAPDPLIFLQERLLRKLKSLKGKERIRIQARLKHIEVSCISSMVT